MMGKVLGDFGCPVLREIGWAPAYDPADAPDPRRDEGAVGKNPHAHGE
jgi:hypothetical protein